MIGTDGLRILVACIGNIFLGDDGFGCEVARALAEAKLFSGVKVVDYGIRGLDLAYALLEPYETVIIVDAIARGETAGTLFLAQPLRSGSEESKLLDAHSMSPASVLAMARALGEIRAEIFIIGCEPADFGDELEGRIGISHAVASAMPEACAMIVRLAKRVQLRAMSPGNSLHAVR